MVRRVALVRCDVSDQPIASIIIMTRIDEMGATLGVASNRRKLRESLFTEFENFYRDI
jgi:hypothetical protein